MKRGRNGRAKSKIAGISLAVAIFAAIALAITLFNLLTAPLLLPNYRAHAPARETLLQMPFSMSRTYTVEMACENGAVRSATVTEWSHEAAGAFALARSPRCSEAISVHRWRKRGRS